MPFTIVGRRRVIRALANQPRELLRVDGVIAGDERLETRLSAATDRLQVGLAEDAPEISERQAPEHQGRDPQRYPSYPHLHALDHRRDRASRRIHSCRT